MNGQQQKREIGDPIKVLPDFGKKCDIVILREDEHIGFRDYALAFLDVAGFIPSDVHAIETIYREEDLEKELPSLMERYPGARVIYDETGTCEDVLVPAGIMAPKAVYDGSGKRKWHAEPKVELVLGEDSREYITSLLQMKARSAVDASMSYEDWETKLPAKLDDVGRQEIAFGMTFGRLPLAFRRSPAIWSPMEGYAEAVNELISSGFTSGIDADWKALAEFPDKYAACVRIWKEVLTARGIPLAFVPAVTPAGVSPRADGLMEIGRALGIDSMIEAYFDGVPVDDILA